MSKLLPALAGGLFVAAVSMVALVLLGALAPVLAASCGKASWYGMETCRKGRACLTATGERFDGRSMTAAHKTLPFGTRLRVTHGKRSVVVRINDRGPFVAGRQLDLSRAAAEQLGMVRAGVAPVCWEIVR